MSTIRPNRSPRLTTVFFGFLASILLVSLAVSTVAVRSHLHHMEEDIQAYGAMRSGQSLHINFTEAMEREWSSVNAVSSTIRLDDLDVLTRRMKALTKIGDHIIWAGVVDTSGVVISSSVDEMVGLDASKAAFFQRGFSSSYVGAAGDDVLTQNMARIFPGESRYIDVSAPVLDSRGSTEGILVYRLGLGWLERVLTASAGALAIDAFLVDGQGQVLIAANAVTGDELSDGEKVAFELGRLDPVRVENPNGAASFVSVMPKLVQGSFSDLDWRIATRVQDLPQELVTFDRVRVATVIGLIIGLWALGSLFARLFLMPIERLADRAVMVSDAGQANSDGGGTYTLAQLASAVAALDKPRK